MATMEVSTIGTTCRRCGNTYSAVKGYFPVCYAHLYKGVGYIPYCKDCIEDMFDTYLLECQSAKKAVRQMCRKLDLYWSEKIFQSVEDMSTSRSVMSSYITKINHIKNAGKSYDDTLREENALWSDSVSSVLYVVDDVSVSKDAIEIPDEVIAFWGPGYSDDMYVDLEQRRKYWMSRLPENVDLDIGAEALIRQICGLEIDISRDRAAGKNTDKNVNTLNTLLGSLNFKPSQKKNEIDASIDNTPFGVWIERWEKKRPIPDPDPAFEDVDGIVKYITTWFLGHISHMLGLKNMYCELYEHEIEKMKIRRPEFADEDSESIFNKIYGVGE